MRDKIAEELLPINPGIVLVVLQKTIEQLAKLESRIAVWQPTDIDSVKADLQNLRNIAHSLEHKAQRLEELL